MRQFPAWKCVGTEPRMDHRQGTSYSLITQIWEILLQLIRCQHAFVDDRATRKTWEIRQITVISDLSRLFLEEFPHHK